MDKHGARCVWHVIDASAIYAMDIPGCRGSKAVYFRLISLGCLPPEISRVLYLDVDIMCLGDLRAAYDTPLAEDKWLIAVKEIGWDPKLHGSDGDAYFNSGFMLIDTQSWREQRITERAIEKLSVGAALQGFDNDALCALYANRVTWVPLCYNTPGTYVGDYPEDTVIVHFWKTFKPWYVAFPCFGRNAAWRECEARSEWRDTPIVGQPHTYSEARLTAKMYWQSKQYSAAAEWYLRYLKWKLFSIKP